MSVSSQFSRSALIACGIVLTARSAAGAQTAAADAAADDLLSFRLNLGAVQDEPQAATASAGDDWRVDLYVWLWLMGLNGDIGVRGLQTHVDESFMDVVESSDSIFAYSGRAEVARGRFGGYIDGLICRLGAEDVSGPAGLADIDVTFNMAVIDFGMMYRVKEWTPTGEAARNAIKPTLDLYAGARYVYLDMELDPANQPSRSNDTDWIDPIVGVKAAVPLAEHWHILAMGDIGGFGVGSDLTWSATGVIAYDFTLADHPASVYLGYRAIGMDFSQGSADDEIVWDLVMHGPLLGFSMFF